jgi:hypothetical protein
MSITQDERELNQATYRRLKKELEKTHNGKFVGIVRGEVVAVAPGLEELLEKLRMIELNPKQGLAFKVGEEYPEYISIL